ncbi:hypothetical protein [uncultured Faecalibaculum sp.]|uniref:hypothetical protein n=1 Tax=uncultured Faecalibaculum sp. TaxID=1729681 RepID=UPI002628F76B|nr:hypothetical protein [uncultured Faecalibaculum sp.]
MSDSDKAIDVFYDMDIAQICQHFNKSRNTVDKAIAKLVKDNPDKDWKYKNQETRRITIKAEGVERLSTYFRKEKHEISAVEMELRYENEKLKAIIEEKEKAFTQIETLYNQRLLLELENSKKTYLLETQTKDERISDLEKENQKLKEKLESSESMQSQYEELKKKEEEYNSKSFFYRLLHKF